MLHRQAFYRIPTIDQGYNNVIIDSKPPDEIPDKPNKIPFVKTNIVKEDIVSQFFTWLQKSIEKGQLKTNQTKARIHVVNEGVILVTPGIFQDFAKTLDQDNANWTAIQQKVLKKNWHVQEVRD